MVTDGIDALHVDGNLRIVFRLYSPDVIRRTVSMDAVLVGSGVERPLAWRRAKRRPGMSPSPRGGGPPQDACMLSGRKDTCATSSNRQTLVADVLTSRTPVTLKGAMFWMSSKRRVLEDLLPETTHLQEVGSVERAMGATLRHPLAGLPWLWLCPWAFPRPWAWPFPRPPSPSQVLGQKWRSGNWRDNNCFATL